MRSKYEEIVKPNLELIAAWCRDGATNQIIADKLEIALSTFYEYINKHSELADALKKNKEFVDVKVENALLKRAFGYDYEEVTTEMTKSGNGDIAKVKKTQKHIPPDVAACYIWLKNRKPDVWRDTPMPNNRDEDDGLFSAIVEAVKK